MKTNVCNLRATERTPDMIYVGRPSKWGNPFSLMQHTRSEAVLKYALWVLTQPALLADLHTLRGKTLACYCYPQRCHAEVLALLADTALGEKPRKVTRR